MSVNAVMLVKNRLALTAQAIRSLCRNTEGDWTLTIVDDGSGPEVLASLKTLAQAYRKQVTLVTVTAGSDDSGVVGRLKDIGVERSRSDWGVSDWLYLSDNDVYFTPGWNTKMETAMLAAEKRAFRLLGGQNHPFHRPLPPAHGRAPLPLGMGAYLAVAGTSWLMRWNTWHRFGPLGGTAKGIGQSEDTAFCNRVRQAGYRVGAMEPPVVIDVSLTTTDGRPALGAEDKPRVPGVIYL